MMICNVKNCLYNDNGICCNSDDVEISETGICLSWDESYIEVEIDKNESN